MEGLIPRRIPSRQIGHGDLTKNRKKKENTKFGGNRKMWLDLGGGLEGYMVKMHYTKFPKN